METLNKKVIGISGVARSGKDTFAAILETKLKEAGKSVKKIALAEPLKHQCDLFLTKNLGVSAFTQSTEEKNIMRPFLVWYGDAQRKRTNGRYWIDLADKTINETNFDYYLITDIRYDHYDRDELYWLKKEMNGTLVHISRYEDHRTRISKVSSPIAIKKFIPPANDHEMINDPKIQKNADFIVQWPTMLGYAEELTTNPEMVKYVEDFLQSSVSPSEFSSGVSS
jgi:hypothetical protein